MTKRRHHDPTDEEFNTRLDLIPREAKGLPGLMNGHRDREDKKQLLAIEAKNVRIEIYLNT